MQKNKNEKILAIETSGRMFSIALAECSCPGGKAPGVRSGILLDAGISHSEILKKKCVELMKRCRWNLKDLTAIAVSTGPGSFTGLRVGVSFARTLAQALQVPLVGINIFETLAAQARKLSPLPLCILIDSIGEECFMGFFPLHSDRPAFPYRVVKIHEIGKYAGDYPKILFAGQGFTRYGEIIRKNFKKRVLPMPHNQNFPRAQVIAEIALNKIRKRNPSKNSWRKVVPFYLRPPLAQERLASSAR